MALIQPSPGLSEDSRWKAILEEKGLELASAAVGMPCS